MKIILLFSFAVSSIISTQSRLIEKITVKTLTTETKTGSSPPVRLARQIDVDYFVGSNDNDKSQESFTNYNRKVRHFNTGSVPVRRPRRESSEHVDRHSKNFTFTKTNSSTSQGNTKSKLVLVKKPIPKYNDMDYDDDFQMKMSKSPVKLIDSGEHEDEDFNVDDYDFDVNHDEFSGRGKPLEPRIKHKGVEVKPKPEVKLPVAPEIKIKSKLNIPHVGTSIKKERSAENQKKTNDKEDDYDESVSTTKEPKKNRDSDDEFNEDNEESKEYYGKRSNVRLIRSPWKKHSATDKFGDKASIVSKVLSILPMFPQIPGHEGNEFVYQAGTDHHNG